MKDTEHLDDSSLCRWLAGVFFVEVTEEQLAAYIAGAADPFLNRISEISDIDSLRSDFENELATLAEMPNTQRVLASDFAALFLLGEQNNAQPYAGLYTENGGTVFGRTHDRMLVLLRERGMARAQQSNEPADHIAYQLEYLAALLQSADTGKPEPAWKDFIDAELLNWLPRWEIAFKRVPTRSAFYPLLAKLARSYLEGLRKT
ncbi:Tat proofreading chaperone TorD [Shimia isoporae]|uniref:Tat proofreading chaperone TorD n=1 Tax=Shimia isoporae TaxID=647720 RepID=A0A4R1NJB8_9RHOB|nr:molecular chaperone TorD family protein [Shimia isoporae]TCL08347.1 Tat proofreading chaperone TorD [Shimia isoporae]